MYTWSPLGVVAPPPPPTLLIILAAAKLSETISSVQFSLYKRKQVIFIGQMSEKQLHDLLYCAGYLVQQAVMLQGKARSKLYLQK